MASYDFEERRLFSLRSNGRTFEQMIFDVVPGVVSVEKTDYDLDRSGVDYVATLRRGSEVYIDLKLREANCSRYWAQGEEIALETWSVKPENGNLGKVGWTLDESKKTHYTLHAFDPVDSDKVFILPFQLLRKVFRSNVSVWRRYYKIGVQNSGTWKSECIFVPAKIVITAIGASMEHQYCDQLSPALATTIAVRAVHSRKRN